MLSPEFGKLVFLMRYFNVMSVSFMEIQFHVKIRAPCLPAITIIIIIILQLNIILQFLILLRKLFSPLVSKNERKKIGTKSEARSRDGGIFVGTGGCAAFRNNGRQNS